MRKSVYDTMPENVQKVLEQEASLSFTLEEWSSIYASVMMCNQKMPGSGYNDQLTKIADRIHTMTKAAGELHGVKIQLQ